MLILTPSINMYNIIMIYLSILLLHITMHSDAGFLPKQVYIFYMDQLTIKVCHSIIFRSMKCMSKLFIVYLSKFPIKRSGSWLWILTCTYIPLRTYPTHRQIPPAGPCFKDILRLWATHSTNAMATSCMPTFGGVPPVRQVTIEDFCRLLGSK